MARKNNNTKNIEPSTSAFQSVPNTLTDLTGKTFGYWTVLGYLGAYKTPKHSYKRHQWLCLCACGEKRTLKSPSFKSTDIANCGCLRKQRISQANRKHGFGGTAIYRTWRHMIQRCHNPKDQAYPHYSARGITVCDRWRFGENGKLGIECFAEDMGERPENHSIDRINNEGIYEPSNCRWATIKEQNFNRSSTLRLELGGKTFTTAELCQQFNIPDYVLYQRLDLGWSVERAVSQPPRTLRRK